MSERVVSVSGKTVTVASVGDGSSGGDVPLATKTTPGVVIAGENISVNGSGAIAIGQATIENLGLVKMGVPVVDVETIAVVDIQSAQDAIAAMGTTLSEVMQALRASGVLATPE